MGSRSSLHEDFVRVKTLMGLEPFEVRFFFRKKFTKFDLALEWLIRNFLKLVKSLLMMFLTIWLVNFLVVKSHMGTLLKWIFVGQKFTKFNLALKLLTRNFLKLVHSLFMMFSTIWLENFLVVKSLMGTPVDWKIFTLFFFSVTSLSPWRYPIKNLLQYD